MLLRSMLLMGVWVWTFGMRAEPNAALPPDRVFFLAGPITFTGDAKAVLLSTSDGATAGAPERVAVVMTLLASQVDS